MKEKKKPNNASIGLTIFSVVVLAISAYLVFSVTDSQNPITAVLQPGSFIDGNTIVPDAVKTNSFSSVEEYRDFIRNNEQSSTGYYGGFARGMAVNTLAADAPMPEMAANDVVQKAGASGAPTDYSGTNVQVKGVDEADIIKTDGEYIYTITGDTLFIIKAYPGKDAEIISKIKFDSNPRDLFIKDDMLAVFGNYHNTEFFRKVNFSPRHGITFFNIYNISDKSSPKMIEDFKFEGNYFRARMKGDYVYFVTNHFPEYRMDYPTPVIMRGEEKIAMPVNSIHYYNIRYDNPQMITVHSINLMNPKEDIDSESVFVEYNQNMYMSHDNIYITYTQNINEWEIQRKIIMKLMEDKITDADKQIIEKIKQTDNDVLSQREKEEKIFQIYQSYAMYLTPGEQDQIQDEAERLLKAELEKYDYFEYTVINKLSYNNGKILASANGKVPGRIINQFSMDEKDNVFRIATTLSPRWSSIVKDRKESTNNVYTLDSSLNIMGRLEGLAPDEQIYSARFIDDRLYMVTFKQVDPFFVIDLSNPSNIRNLGELKIPGFSRYLHPYDKNIIIGIGQDATETGRTKGLKISLFDVTDVSNPKEIAKFVTDERYATSTALYNHHAFLFSKEKNLLVIPAYSNRYTYRGEEENGYNGAFVFHITKDEINLRGLIDHSKGTTNYWSPSVERSLYIEDLLYTKSPTLLRINKIDTLESVKDIELKTGNNGNIPVY